MFNKKYAECLDYIDKYWDRIIFKPLKKGFVKIPHSFFVPNDNMFKNVFYWDSFIMSKGLRGTKRQWIMKDMVENFIYFYNKLQVIPNFNAPVGIGRSQPPLLSSMIIETYQDLNNNKTKSKNTSDGKWLEKAVSTAQKEYENVWIDKDNKFNHHVDGHELSRYGDRDIGYALTSELESGWDLTSRFYNRCNEFLPVDLNSFLYKYESDFSFASSILDKNKESELWKQKVEKRKKLINKFMWKEDKGFFYDYRYKNNELSDFFSLAGFTPLWAGIATAGQADKMIKILPKFETPYGLTITAKESLAAPFDLSKIHKRYHSAIEEISKPKQWDYPNIWSPMEYLTVIGILRYGFIKDAVRIMTNSVKAHAAAFKKFGTFFEKLNGETGESGSGAEYKDQKGFGWTNAVFYRYIQILDALDANQNIYTAPKPVSPPFTLSIIH